MGEGKEGKSMRVRVVEAGGHPPSTSTDVAVRACPYPSENGGAPLAIALGILLVFCSGPTKLHE